MIAMGADTQVVLGATGGIGGAVVDALVAERAAGRLGSIRAVARRPPGRRQARPGVSWVAADVSAPEAAAEAVRGAGTVYHCVQPGYTRWPTDFPQLNRSVLAAVAQAGARLVYADNLYGYGPVPGPLHEDLPLAATGPKGTTRAALARELLAAHRSGRAEVVIARITDYYGPGGGNSTMTGARFFEPALAGKPVRIPFAIDVVHSYSFLPDVGRALVLLGSSPDTAGDVWHIPAAEPVTLRQFADITAHALGREVRLRRIPPLALRLAAVFTPIVRELPEIAYQFNQPFIIDGTKFARHFPAFAPTPHAEAIAATLDWFAASDQSAAVRGAAA
jgi:nucleoside-diphosphate-sugar epimerase